MSKLQPIMPWDGKEALDKIFLSGIYICRLEAGKLCGKEKIDFQTVTTD